MSLALTPASVLSNVSTLSRAISSFSRVDVVAILDQSTLKQVFSGFSPVKAEVKEWSKVMDYPVETGAIWSDHKIDLPTEITMTGIIPESEYGAAYIAIRSAWKNATPLSVQTRTGIYKNMVISSMPHEETPDKFNAVMITSKLREVIVAQSLINGSSLTVENFSPRDTEDYSTSALGLVSALNATSAALGVFQAARLWGLQ